MTIFYAFFLKITMKAWNQLREKKINSRFINNHRLITALKKKNT